MQSIYWLEKVLKMISLYVNALLCILENWHRWVASRVWQYAAACTKVYWRRRRSFPAPSLTSKYFTFAFVYFISCTESETYAHVGLRDGGPVFRAPSVYIYIVYVQASKHNTDVFAPVMIHILSYDTVKSYDRSVFPKLFCLRAPVAFDK